MSSFFALRALLFAGELFAGSLLILTLAWLAASQKSASARHLIWTAAFGASLALPALAAIMPSNFHILLAAPAPIPPPQTFNDAAFIAAPPDPAASGFSIDPSTLVLMLGALWLAGACVVALRLAIGAVCLAALKRRSRPYALAPGDEPKVAASAQECELRLCDHETGPITWGLFHPVILLPKTATVWPRERLHAVLLHELAHIRRRDCLTQALVQAACAVYWPNPLVWMAAKRLRREAEIAADDAAIVAGLKPSVYAGELLQLAQEFRTQQPNLSSVAFFMAAPSALEARVESVLSPTNSRSGVTAMDVLKIAGIGFVAASAMAFACPSLAQETQPAAPVTTTELPAPAAQAAPEAPPAPAANAASEMSPANAANVTTPADSESATGAPDAAPVPPAPPADPVAPTSPADDATTRVIATTPTDTSGSHVHVWVDGRNWDSLSSANRERVRRDIATAKREAREAAATARRETREAIAQARAGEDAVRDVQPQIDAAMADVAKHRADIEKAVAEAHVSEEAMREAQPQIDAAMAEVAKHRGEIEKAMAKVQPEIDAAMAKVRADLAKQNIDVRIQERVDAALKRAEIRIEAAQTRTKDSDREDRVEQWTVKTDDK